MRIGDIVGQHKKVIIQKVKEIKGNAGAYEQWAIANRQTAKGQLGDRFEFLHEPPQANPDELTEDQGMYADSQMTAAQMLMGDAIEHLQGRQKDCYIAIMRQGLSFAEAAKLLKISKSAVQIYKTRAVNFITAYCKQQLDKRNG